MSLRHKLLGVAAGGLLVAGIGLAGGTAANASTFPSCPGTATTGHCFNVTAPGEAGYFYANDEHTHLRDVFTVTYATAGLIQMNGTSSTGVTCGDGSVNPSTHIVTSVAQCGADGVELCNNNFTPTSPVAAQLGLWYGTVNGTNGYHVSYDYDAFSNPPSGEDPCISSGIVNPAKLVSQQILNVNFAVQQGDKLSLEIWYNPWSGPHHHQISYGVCDITQGVCAQAYSPGSYNENFTELGYGSVAAGGVMLTGGANNFVAPFEGIAGTCYACAARVQFTTMAPVNPWDIGGPSEAQFVNPSGQAQMSPNNSLNTSDNFGIWSGSTTP